MMKPKKLTPAEEREIEERPRPTGRSGRRRDPNSVRGLAQEFRVSEHTITRIRRRAARAAAVAPPTEGA
jgi:hypothetical protein